MWNATLVSWGLEKWKFGWRRNLGFTPNYWKCWQFIFSPFSSFFFFLLLFLAKQPQWMQPTHKQRRMQCKWLLSLTCFDGYSFLFNGIHDSTRFEETELWLFRYRLLSGENRMRALYTILTNQVLGKVMGSLEAIDIPIFFMLRTK